DDRADTAAAAAVQQMVEQGRLAGAEESGEDDDGNLRRVQLRLRTRLAFRAPARTQDATSLAPTRTPAHDPACLRGWNEAPGYEPPESPRSERLSAASAGRTSGKAPECATLASL